MTSEPPSGASSRSISSQDTITLDLLIRVVGSTLFHPFLAALIPLCLRAQATSLTSPAFIITSAFAALVCAYHVFYLLDQWLAFGPARKMNWMREVVVITGGKGGLGSVLAEILAMRGVAVAVLDVAVTEMKEGEEEEGSEEDTGTRLYKCDVGDVQELEKVWGRVVCELGTPTILINNAAVSNPSPFLSQSPEEVSRLFATNTLSHFTLTRLFLRTLLSSSGDRRRKGGHIVTVSSVLGHLGAVNLSAYTASKAALMAYHASLAAELRTVAPLVKTILVAQGQLDTEMFRKVRLRGWLQRFLGPVIGAREVAMAIVKLLDQGKGGEVRLPAYAAMIPWLFILPSGLGRLLRDFSGVDSVVVVDGRENGWIGGGVARGLRGKIRNIEEEGSDGERISSEEEEEEEEDEEEELEEAP